MTKSKHAFKVLSVIKALLNGEEVTLGNVRYKLNYNEGNFEVNYYSDTLGWHPTNIGIEWLTQLCGNLTDSEITEINTKNL